MTITVETSGRVLRMTLDRPADCNALDWHMLEGLSDALDRLEQDDDLWVGVLTGTGEQSFCSGADLKRLLPQVAEKRAEGIGLPTTMLTGRYVDKPLVCAINGDALGGGLELVLGCDIRIAAAHATFGLPEGRWGFVPAGGGTQRLPHLIGAGRALEMMLTAQPIDATIAHSWGLLHRVVPGDALIEETEQVIENICAVAPLAARAIKRLVVGGTHSMLDSGLHAEQVAVAELQSSYDAAEGLRAFAERRNPAWQGR